MNWEAKSKDVAGAAWYCVTVMVVTYVVVMVAGSLMGKTVPQWVAGGVSVIALVISGYFKFVKQHVKKTFREASNNKN